VDLVDFLITEIADGTQQEDRSFAGCPFPDGLDDLALE
jgi:hypothetical protein